MYLQIQRLFGLQNLVLFILKMWTAEIYLQIVTVIQCEFKIGNRLQISISTIY